MNFRHARTQRLLIVVVVNHEVGDLEFAFEGRLGRNTRLCVVLGHLVSANQSIELGGKVGCHDHERLHRTVHAVFHDQSRFVDHVR